MSRLAKILEDGLAYQGMSLTDHQKQQLVGYVELLDKWNKAYNLTSVRNPDEMMVRHILDSLTVAQHLASDASYIDVGTGPGLPGIPLAIAMPNANFTLLDSLGKRVRFMMQVKHLLKLDNINPIQSRVEAHQPPAPYDAILSRAFASINDMLNWCGHLGQQFLAMKGVYPEQEIADLPNEFELKTSHSLDVYELSEERHLVVIEKTSTD
ncbi:16S rRNA (guanine(527)-N(7))-methyltransferase RsmG [Echinimonas agarilytica]|uniref:Ribosomal RNA small subunit methyltransferase G n=1 Tax=Echinimonas agarilytica TaxID=1215918 RepID=A0AA42B5Z2_9GAMM|nr:16S rRNA (guanine(527)-N(7))-methyltransferase RsmG [Echinimonas agarilytica]MCM2678114.1 16S rRNA (guanine(527)-N(7))-methyltransferase RsmG [Echinimonas agarilytica]